MVEQSLKTLSATKLKIVLISTLIFLVLIGGVLFWFLRGQLVEYAIQVNESETSATTSDASIVRLKKLQKILNDDKDSVESAANIAGDSQTFEYQEKILKDLSTYEKKTGIKIVSINFDEVKESAATAMTIPGAITTPGALDEPGAGDLANAPGGEILDDTSMGLEGGTAAPASTLKEVIITISITNPVKYASIMQFIRLIEFNLPKMQISGLSFTNTDAGSNKLSLEYPSMTIRTYIK